MKLWLVLWAIGGVGATIGPLPDDIDNCQRMALDANNNLALSIREEPTMWRSFGDRPEFYCSHQRTRPALGDRSFRLAD